MKLDLESGSQVILVNNLDLLGLWVFEEAIIELEELVRLNAHSWYDTLSFDGYGKHILTDTLKVHNKNHIVDVRHTWDELYHDLCGAVLGQASAVVLDVEFVLERSSITRDSHYIVDVHLRGVRQVDSLGFWELIRNLAKIDNVFRETEGWSNDVALECQGQHFGTALKGKAESLRELTKDIAHESDS